MSDDIERSLREAMMFRSSGRHAPLDLAARVHRRHRRRRWRVALLATAGAVVVATGSFTAYHAANIQTTSIAPPAGGATPTHHEVTSLCAGMPTGPEGGKLTASPHPNGPWIRTPPPGLRVGYLPPGIRGRLTGTPGSSLTKGPYWYNGYGWQWGGPTSDTAPPRPFVMVEVICGAAANSLTGMRHTLGGFTAGPAVTVNGLKTYIATGQDRGSAFMLVRPGLAIEVYTFEAGDLNAILRGIHVTG
jgi:hypothetical protein